MTHTKIFDNYADQRDIISLFRLEQHKMVRTKQLLHQSQTHAVVKITPYMEICTREKNANSRENMRP